MKSNLTDTDKLIEWLSNEIPKLTEYPEKRGSYQFILNTIRDGEFEPTISEDVQLAIVSLEYCQAMILFNPTTGETSELWQENKDNQDLYNACDLAVQALQMMQGYNGTCDNCGGQIMKGHIFCGYCGEFPDSEKKEPAHCDRDLMKVTK